MPNAVQFYGGKVLFGDSAGNNTDKVAFASGCCCGDGDGDGAGCDACSDGGPEEFQVNISGIIKDYCDDCASLNDVFVLSVFQMSPGWCIWSYELPTPLCLMTHVLLYVDLYEGDKYRVFVILGDYPYLDHTITWEKGPYETTPDCKGFNGENIPYLHEVGSGCDPSSSTCLVTAL